MSPILVNSSTSNLTSLATTSKKFNNAKLESTIDLSNDDDKNETRNIEKAREERKATGRTIALMIFFAVIFVALYHLVQKSTPILTGILVSASIIFTYLFFVVHVSSREKKRRKQLEEAANNLELSSGFNNLDLQKKSSNPSLSSVSIPSTSGMVSKHHPKVPGDKSARIDPRIAKMLLETRTDSRGSLNTTVKKTPAPFKKTQSQSQIQQKDFPSTHISIENEKKKLKKSRSFDKNNYLVEQRHVIDNKKIKTKH